MVYVWAESVGSCTWAIQTQPGSVGDPFKIGSDRNRSATVWAIKPRWLLTQGPSAKEPGLGSLCPGQGATCTWGLRVPPSPGWSCRCQRVQKMRMAGLWRVAVMVTMQERGSKEAATAPDLRRQVCWGMLVFVSQRRTVEVPYLRPGPGHPDWPPCGTVFGETQPDHRALSSVPGADQHQRDGNSARVPQYHGPSLPDCRYNHGACGAPRHRALDTNLPSGIALLGTGCSTRTVGLVSVGCSAIGHVGRRGL